MASAILSPCGLAYGSLRWAERRWWYRDGCQDRSKHCARFLAEKSLRRGRTVRPCEEEGMYCGQTGPLSGVIEASQLVIPQCQGPVTPFHIGARAVASPVPC